MKTQFGWKACTALAMILTLSLAGCSGGGGGHKSGSSSSPASSGGGSTDGGTGGTPSTLVTADVASDVGTTVSGVGDGISALGDSLATVPVVGGLARSAVSTTGNVVDSVGEGLTNGLGKLGSDPRP